MTQFDKFNPNLESGDHAADGGIGPSAFGAGSGLNKYRILERVCRTPYAISYIARDAFLDRLVFIKQLQPSRIDDPVACADFKHEAQLLARLSTTSRNIARIHELIGDEHGLFLVFEHVDGEALELKISKKLIGATGILKILRGGCLALGSLQKHRIVHRDVNPRNWYLATSGNLVLTNFSTACTEGEDQPPMTFDHRYAAPELIKGKPTDCRADVYSLGLILYEVAVGRLQFKSFCRDSFGTSDPSNDDWAAWHCDERALLPDPRELNHQVSAGLATVIGEMTRKDVDERAASAQKILQDALRRLSNRGNDQAKALPPPTNPTSAYRRLPFEQAQPHEMPALDWLVDQRKATTTQSLDYNIKTDNDKRLRPPRIVREVEEGPSSHRPRLVTSNPVATGATTPARRRRTEQPVLPPAPQETEEPRRIRTSVLLSAVAVLTIVAVSIYFSFFTVNQLVELTPTQKEAKALLADASTALSQGDMQAAMNHVLDVKAMSSNKDALTEYAESAWVLELLIDASQAVEQNEFLRAETLLTEARVNGADPDLIARINDRLVGLRETQAIEAAVEELLASNRYEKATLSTDEYRRYAEKAGLDPDRLKARLDEARTDREFEKAMDAAHSAIEERNFEAALLNTRDALAIRESGDARLLLMRILDLKRQDDLRIRGDRAFTASNFEEAEKFYAEALEIEPNEELETRLRTATAARLYVEANEALARGELLQAQRLLKNSMWQKRSQNAAQLLARLTPAFEAADAVQRANLAIDGGDLAQARRLLRAAIPNLPSPARERAEETLARIKSD